MRSEEIVWHLGPHPTVNTTCGRRCGVVELDTTITGSLQDEYASATTIPIKVFLTFHSVPHSAQKE